MHKVNYCLSELICSQIAKYKFNSEIIKSLKIILKNTDVLNIFESMLCDSTVKSISDDEFQNSMGILNEKTAKRKDNGVYYTSKDISKYIIINSIITKYSKQTRVFSYDEGLSFLNNLTLKSISNLLFNMKIIDPTCGSGEFIIAAFMIKEKLCKKITDDNLLNIAKTIFGNDIDFLSVIISKIRLFFYIADKLSNNDSYVKLAKIINNQFYCIDFISNHKMIKHKFDITVGNPPYVEYSRYPNAIKLTNKLGNVYADVLLNSFDILNRDGIIGYIIPLSYSSTLRMKKIRDIINLKTNKQLVLSFADRPDCLFSGVHQKLNIIIAKTGDGNSEIATSKYLYWYKQERESLFNNIDIIKQKLNEYGFIPKLSNAIEESIFNKIHTNTNQNIISIQEKTDYKVFLNMRACFWIKAFTFNPGSNEYKEFSFSERYRDYVLCLLNSSLFWFFWIVVSDCWHITTKELSSFYVAEIEDAIVFNDIALRLETKLEETKKYIGTKQATYEYKHKLCKDIIDEIDDILSDIYNLTMEETEYVKNYALKYRKGDGAID